MKTIQMYLFTLVSLGNVSLRQKNTNKISATVNIMANKAGKT